MAEAQSSPDRSNTAVPPAGSQTPILPLHTRARAPNILLILLDDVGFSASSTFGGPVQTPYLDGVAMRGLRYNRFHVAALCSPTRAALLSGRNDHRAGFGQIMEMVSDSPGYDGIWRKDTVTIAEVLRRNGYSTAAFGKWHNTPYSEISPVGPFERWPTGLGFEYFYGIMRGYDSQWEPSSLYRNTTPVEPSATPREGYHLTTDVVDDAIAWVRTHDSLAPDKPYFLYFAPAATHAPFHVPKEWIDRYRGGFRQGWDKVREETFAKQKKLGVIPTNAELTPRPAELRAWGDLSKDQQKISAMEMEAFAGFLAHTDHEVGRLLEAVLQGPQAENTLILYIVGDNGAEGHGDRDAQVNASYVREKLGGVRTPVVMYSAEWAWATSTPFQWTKFVASHLGGTRAPLVVSWPSEIKDAGALRSQYTHANDVAATIYESAGISFPSVVDGVEQQPLDGVSFVYSFKDPGAPSRHRVQIFEQAGNRAIYQDGWLAGALHMIPWMRWKQRPDFVGDEWELYFLDEDFSQARNVAKRYPEKLREMQAAFDREARKSDVYPLTKMVWPRQEPPPEQRTYTYYPGLPRISALGDLAPKFGTQSYVITAELETDSAAAEGVILTYGARGGGFALYIKDNKLVYENQAGIESSRELIAVDLPSHVGAFSVASEFTRSDISAEGSSAGVIAGTVKLYIDGKQVAQRFISGISPDTYAGTLGIGQAFGSPVSTAFQPPFKFTGGRLHQVTVQLR